ncbi:MAG: MATE family efflux transporter [Lachnospiraceae bacterium]|nr:MATE family efflux transporter [Lachnospiraceae bacterium]
MNKQFYKSFFSLFALLVLQNVVTIAVNLADNIMIGGYSETALSGVATVNQVMFVYQQLLMALADSLVIFGSRFFGEGNLPALKRTAAIAMRAALYIGLVMFALSSLFPHRLLSLFTDDAPIIEQGMAYLSIIRYTYLFFAITQILLGTLRSIQSVRIAFVLSLVAFCVNCGINYVLIYGRFGAPEMGTEGAAIGTLTARVTELLVLLLYIGRREKTLRLRFFDFLGRDRTLRRDYTRIAIPNVIASALWGLNIAMQTVILGHMTASAIAANSISSTLYLLLKSAAVGAVSASAVTIGRIIGLEGEAAAKRASVRLQRIFVVIGITAGVLIHLISGPIIGLYNLSEETRQLTVTFMMIQTVALVFMSYQMPTNCGIVKGGGSVDYVLKLDFISIWCIVIPVSLLAAFVFDASPAVVVCCLNADQVFKCVPAYIKVNHCTWIKRIVSE